MVYIVVFLARLLLQSKGLAPWFAFLDLRFQFDDDNYDDDHDVYDRTIDSI